MGGPPHPKYYIKSTFRGLPQGVPPHLVAFPAAPAIYPNDSPLSRPGSRLRMDKCMLGGRAAGDGSMHLSILRLRLGLPRGVFWIETEAFHPCPGAAGGVWAGWVGFN